MISTVARGPVSLSAHSLDATRLTVAVPTRNRRESALGALEAIAAQLQGPDELLVIDNGSVDGTKKAVAAWLEERRVPARVLDEPSGGVSAARNTALREASTEVVCFVDDDVRVEPGWLEALRHAWAAAGPRVACIGGPLSPEWEVPRPAWLADHLLYVLSVLELGHELRRLDQSPGTGHVWGGNFSVHVEAVRAVGGFDTELGVRPDAPFGRDEEEDLQRRLAQAGWETWYEPAAPARHLLGAEKLNEDFFLQAFRSRAERAVAAGRPRWKGLRPLVRGAARYIARRAVGRADAPAARFDCAYGWTLLTGSRSPRHPSNAL